MGIKDVQTFLHTEEVVLHLRRGCFSSVVYNYSFCAVFKDLLSEMFATKSDSIVKYWDCDINDVFEQNIFP